MSMVKAQAQAPNNPPKAVVLASSAVRAHTHCDTDTDDTMVHDYLVDDT
jgi:hypothetical protein